MFSPSISDYKELKKWGTDSDPHVAVTDYRPFYEWLRWLKPYQWRAHFKYYSQRAHWIGNFDFQKYFTEADRTIKRQKWQYLQLRKSWYQIPLGWEKFSEKSTKNILDFGCGDGDLTQRIADHIKVDWKKEVTAHPVTITGVDLSPSRINNAKKLCQSPHSKIKMNFKVVDGTKGLPYTKKYFDYTVVCGVFEILNDNHANIIAADIARVTKKGIYIEDLADHYPGGYPRKHLEALFIKHRFSLTQKEIVLSEPFSLTENPDPCKLWPILKIQLLFLERQT